MKKSHREQNGSLPVGRGLGCGQNGLRGQQVQTPGLKINKPLGYHIQYGDCSQ